MHNSIDSKDSQERQKPAKDAKEKDVFSVKRWMVGHKCAKADNV